MEGGGREDERDIERGEWEEEGVFECRISTIDCPHIRKLMPCIFVSYPKGYAFPLSVLFKGVAMPDYYRTLNFLTAELALITNKPRAASVHAVGEVTCAGTTHCIHTLNF